MRTKILLIVLLIVVDVSVNAQTNKSRGVPANPQATEMLQADGTKIILKLKGDAVIHWYETLDGYKVLKNENGDYSYAILDSNGNMKASQSLVGNRNRTNGIHSQQSIKKDIFYSQEQIKDRERSYFEDKNSSKMNAISRISKVKKAFVTKGAFNGLMILAEFSDKPHVIEPSRFEDIMNKENYNNTGSFRDYYLENSYNQLDFTTDIVKDGVNYVWVTLPYSMAYYGANDSNGNDVRPRDMVMDACKAADKLGIDFSEYDYNQDGYVDNVMIVHSGFGEENANADDNWIWSHRWSVRGLLSLDGVSLADYATFPECSGSTGDAMTNLGVLAHEFGHILGLPDYYDTDYSRSGGQDYGLGQWDIMSGGSWNNNGITPAQHNAYSKYFLDWIDLPVLNSSTNPSSGGIVLKDITTNQSGAAYMIKSHVDNEFFVIENRQQNKFNAAIPYHGMIVYHVDRNYNVTSGGDSWYSNSMNNNPSHPAMEILFANNSTFSSAIPFPGSASIDEISDYTGENYSVVATKKPHDPTLVNWNLSKSGSSLKNIREEDGLIKFNYMPNQEVTLDLSLTFKFDGEESSVIDFSDYEIRFTNLSNDEVSMATFTESGEVKISNFDLGLYDLELVGTDKTIVYDNKNYDVSFVKEYNDFEISESNVNLELKIVRDLSVTFKYKNEIKNFDYTGFSVEFTKDGPEALKLNLDIDGKCSLNSLYGGTYNMKLYPSVKEINLDGKLYNISFLDEYNNVDIFSSVISIELKEVRDLSVVFQFDETNISNVDYASDRLIIKKADKVVEIIELDSNGIGNIEETDPGVYDIVFESTEKSVVYDGQSFPVIFSALYENVDINASKIDISLKQDFKVNVFYKYDARNKSKIDFTDHSILLSNLSSDISIPLDYSGIGDIVDVDHSEYDVNLAFDTEELTVDGINRVLFFQKSYKLDFNSTSSYVDLELQLLGSKEMENIKIFPNPTTGFTQIEAKLSSNAILRVYDMTGLLVIDKLLVDGDLQNSTLHGLDLTALNAGIYNVLIIDGDNKVSRRVVKE